MATTIRYVNTEQPNFPATDQHPSAARVQIGSLWVDYIGSVPVQADIDAFFAPGIAAQTKVDAFVADTNYQALLTQLKGANSPAQINTWLTNNVTSLAQARGVLAMLLFYIVVRDRVN
jgi:hypothetical protein